MGDYANKITDQYGRPIGGASILVLTSQGEVATLTTAGGSPLGNPLLSAEDGTFAFRVDDGLYRIEYRVSNKLYYTDESVVIGEGIPVPDSVIAALGTSTGSNIVGYSDAGGAATTVQARLRDIKEGAGSALVAFTNTGTGAVTTSVQKILRQTFSLYTYGFVGDGVTDDGNAWRAAIAAAGAAGGGVIDVPWGSTGISKVTTPIVNGTMPAGITFRGVGSNKGNGYASGLRLLYTGTGTCWSIKFTTGFPAEQAHYEWHNLAFETTNPAATVFDFNDASVTRALDSDAYQIITYVAFRGCGFFGPDGGIAQTGDAIRAAKAFHVSLDSNCYIQNFRRGIWLYGCDNSRVDARVVGCAQNIRVEGSGTYGSGCTVESNFVGFTKAQGGDARYVLYFTAQNLVMDSGTVEGIGDEIASLYINGRGIRILSPAFGASKPFHLGPDAKDCEIMIPNGNDILPPLVDDPATYDFGYSDSDHRLIVRGASPSFRQACETADLKGRVLFDAPRLGWGTPGSLPVRTNARNFFGRGFGTNASAAVQGFPVDTAARVGRAILLSKDVASGFFVAGKMGLDFPVGASLVVKVRARYLGSLTSGEFAIVYIVNGTESGTITQLPAGTSYAITTMTLNTASLGLVAGDVLAMGVRRYTTPNVSAHVDYLEVTE